MNCSRVRCIFCVCKTIKLSFHKAQGVLGLRGFTLEGLGCMEAVSAGSGTDATMATAVNWAGFCYIWPHWLLSPYFVAQLSGYRWDDLPWTRNAVAW